MILKFTLKDLDKIEVNNPKELEVCLNTDDFYKSIRVPIKIALGKSRKLKEVVIEYSINNQAELIRYQQIRKLYAGKSGQFSKSFISTEIQTRCEPIIMPQIKQFIERHRSEIRKEIIVTKQQRPGLILQPSEWFEKLFIEILNKRFPNV